MIKHADLQETVIPPIPWNTVYNEDGILLQSSGEGTNLVVFPGLEGSGESCLHLLLPMQEKAFADNAPLRLILVNYAHENHVTLIDLIASVNKGLKKLLGNDSCIFFAQSFGNLLAAGVLELNQIHVKKALMVSPFTSLPSLLTKMSVAVLYVTPTFLYRATIKPLGRYVFGPVGENGNHPFFGSLARATSSQVKRQTQWMVNAQFDDLYTSINIPAKIWLGEKDRLVDLDEQLLFFKNLASRKMDFVLAIIPDCGHVVLPDKAATFMKADLYEWLTPES